MNKKQKLETKYDDVCDALSLLDCTECTSNITHMSSCTAVCGTSPARICSRNALSVEVPFCMQHLMSMLKGRYPTNLTNVNKLTMIQKVKHIIHHTNKWSERKRKNYAIELDRCALRLGRAPNVTELSSDILKHHLFPFQSNSERIDLALANRANIPDRERDSECTIDFLLTHHGHPSLQTLRQSGRWIDDRDAYPPPESSNNNPIYIWCHDIGQTERIVNLYDIHHVVVIGTFDNCTRSGVVTNDNIFRSNIHIRSITYILPWLKEIGNEWMYTCQSLQYVHFTGLSDVKRVGNHWMSDCRILESPNFTGLSNLTHIDHGWLRTHERSLT